MKSFPGLAMQFGGPAPANCACCHGFHNILPASDPCSSVHKANLPQTCSKCHPGIGTRPATPEFRIHELPGPQKGKPWIVNFVARFSIVLIVVTLGAMATFNAPDYLAKTRAHARAVDSVCGNRGLPDTTRKNIQRIRPGPSANRPRRPNPANPSNGFPACTCQAANPNRNKYREENHEN